MEGLDLVLKLKELNLDVSMVGVSAYSTLDWFNKPWLPNYFSDPVLSTFLLKHDVVLIATIIHEMAHQVVYVELLWRKKVFVNFLLK